jgi:hypothetical protein
MVGLAIGSGLTVSRYGGVELISILLDEHQIKIKTMPISKDRMTWYLN